MNKFEQFWKNDDILKNYPRKVAKQYYDKCTSLETISNRKYKKLYNQLYDPRNLKLILLIFV